MEKEMITTALQQYNITDAAIAKYKAEYMALSVQGATDEEGYKIVKSARMEIVHKRTDVEKKRKELNSDALKYKKAVDDEAKRITALLAPIEDHLIAQEKIIDDEKARIKAEAEAKEAARISDRINRLYVMGCTFNGMNYFLPFAPDGYAVPSPIVKASTYEQFEAICGEFQKLVDTETKRVLAECEAKIAEEERLAKIRADQEAEAKRLEAMAKEQAEAAAKIKAAEEKIEAEKQRLIDEEKARVEAADREKQRIIDEENRAIELEKAKVEAALQAVKEAEEKERLAKAAADHLEKIKPDKDKLLAFADAIDLLRVPVLENSKAIDIRNIAIKAMSAISAKIRREAKEI
jgi:hypothetical protein